MLNGTILDLYPDPQKNVMVTWLTDKGRAKRVEDYYEPFFYVHSSREKLCRLIGYLRQLPEVKYLSFEVKKTIINKNTKKLVLKITPKKITSLSDLAKMINSWGKYHDYDLYNVDIRMPSRYLQEKKVFCNGNVLWDGKKFQSRDNQWAIDYKTPNYKKTTIKIKRKSKSRILSFNDQIQKIIIDNTTIEEENEADTILSMVKHVQKKDPDIIFIHKGDSIELPFLYHRAKQHDVQKQVNLGRDPQNRLRPIKKSKSYFSYGQILYRPAFYTLYGRAHIDTYNSFLYEESSIRGLIDISRCSNIPIQYLSRVGPGTAISQIQVNDTLEKNYMIPWKKNTPETWKTAMDLLISDRGGLILEPKVGLYDNVIELDFASLYPSIMLNFNISPETMLCSCCKNTGMIVPQLGYHICIKNKGFLPEILKKILERRFCYKARSKNKKYNTQAYKELQQAWKWILLVCFGYTGYRNARYGRIECYESITAYSRDILLKAVQTAEKAGYQVIHGIIDSLWIKPIQENPVKTVKLVRMIGNQVGIRMDIEGYYKWIVFLPSKQTKTGALNRYYGLFKDGKLKTRGIELRQRNSPVFLKNMQKDILYVFSKAENKEEFKKLIPETVEVIKKHAIKIINSEVENKKLVFKTRVSRDITEYKVNTLAKSALFQLRDLNVEIEPGQSIKYIVCDENTRNYKKRVCILENLEENTEYDIDFYLRQIAQCAESILVPFDFTLEKIYEMLQKIKYREKYNVSILPRIRTCQTSI